MKAELQIPIIRNLTSRETPEELDEILDERWDVFIRQGDWRIGPEYYSFREAERGLMAQRLEKKGKIEDISYDDLEHVIELGTIALAVLRERFDKGETGLDWRIKYAEANLELIRRDIRSKRIYDIPIRYR